MSATTLSTEPVSFETHPDRYHGASSSVRQLAAQVHERIAEAHAALSMSGPALHLRGEDGRRSVFAGFDTQGVSKFELADSELVGRVALLLGANDGGGVQLSDAEGYPRLLARYDYPPDKEDRAVELVLEQAVLFAQEAA